jgi:WD40 repeat protein
MTFKKFLSLLIIGVALLLGLVFLRRLGQRNISRNLPSMDETLPPLVPRTVEIPDEIRQKYAKVPEKPELIAELEHSGTIDSVAFSPIDPSLVVSKVYDKDFNKRIKLWNINHTSEPIAVLSGDSVSFSPNGDLLAICSLTGGVRFWDVAEEQFISTFDSLGRNHLSLGRNLLFSPDGRWLAIGSRGVELCDIRSPTIVKKGPRLPSERLTENLTYSSDGKLLATTYSVNNEVDIWDIASLERIKTIKQDDWRIETLKFSPEPDNPLLAIVDDDNDEIKLFSAPEWHAYATISAKYVNDLTFTPDGKTLVSGGHNEIEFWSVESGERITSIEGYSRWINCVDISADGKFVASGGNDGVIRIWDIAENLHAQQIAPSDAVKIIYFLPSDRAPTPDIPEKLDKFIKDVQKYYADEMERHGLGRKTFTLEKNEDDSAKIYLFEGRSTEDYYLKNISTKVEKEIYDRFDPSKNIYLIIADISSESINKITGMYGAGPKISYKDKTRGQRGGDIIMTADPNKFSPIYMSKMFGYAFGLDQDFRDASYLMSNGRKRKQLSKSSAEWLNKSRLFNPNQTFFDETSTVEKLTPQEGKVRFKVKDIDGIHQVRLLVRPTDEDPPPGYEWNKDPEQNKIDWESKHKGRYFVLYDYLTLNAEKEATVEFNFPEFAKNMVRVQIIDGHGNMVYREMKLVEKRENATKTLIRRILSGR